VRAAGCDRARRSAGVVARGDRATSAMPMPRPAALA